MFGKMYKDRVDAAKKLLPKLKKFKDDKDAVILAIPRGALELGAVLRDKLGIPLDIVVTKKIGAPGNDEYAIGSVGPDGKASVNESVIAEMGIPEKYIDEKSAELKKMIRERYVDYRGDPEPPDLKGKTVIVVDDGIATGFTILAAVKYIRSKKPKKIVVAVPVSARDSYEKLKAEVDEMICPDVPMFFAAVGQFYDVFREVTDEEAKKLLRKK